MWGWYWRGGNQSMGAEGVHVRVCLCLREHTWCTAHTVCLCWSEGTLVFEEDAPGSTPVSWACTLFPHLFFFFIPICSKSPVVIATSSLRRSFKNKHHIFLCYFCVELCITTLVMESKCETQQGMLSRCHHTLLFTVHMLLSNGLPHPVTPHYTHTSSNVSLGHKNCCTNLHFSIPCYCSWYIDIKCIVECHKMSLPKAICQAFNPAVSAKSLSTLSPRFPLSS